MFQVAHPRRSQPVTCTADQVLFIPEKSTDAWHCPKVLYEVHDRQRKIALKSAPNPAIENTPEVEQVIAYRRDVSQTN
jgi:hypothetical protein